MKISKEEAKDPKQEQLDRMELRLTEICMWMRFQNRELLRALLLEVLRSDRDRLVFELTDGLSSATEIAKAAKVSQPRISQIWNSWKPLGIVVEVPGTRGKYKHICSLNELGMKTALPSIEAEPSSD